MTKNVHQHPGGKIYVRVDNSIYDDTAQNFGRDFGYAWPRPPQGFNERIYDQGRRHVVMGTAADGSAIQRGDVMPWSFGDQVIIDLPAGLAAQTARRQQEAIPPLPDAKLRKGAELDAEYNKRAQAPIDFTVAAGAYQWHATQEAEINLSSATAPFISGQTSRTHRPWYPYQSRVAVDVTYVELVNLSSAISDRRSDLLVTKKAKEDEIAALTDVQAVLDYDVTTGW